MAISIHGDLSISGDLLEERILDCIGGAFDRRDKESWAASLVWVSLANQTFMNRSFPWAFFVTSPAVQLAIVVGFAFASLTSGKKTQTTFVGDLVRRVPAALNQIGYRASRLRRADSRTKGLPLTAYVWVFFPEVKGGKAKPTTYLRVWTAGWLRKKRPRKRSIS